LLRSPSVSARRRSQALSYLSVYGDCGQSVLGCGLGVTSSAATALSTGSNAMASPDASGTRKTVAR
jgi:hypothetical protein